MITEHYRARCACGYESPREPFLEAAEEWVRIHRVIDNCPDVIYEPKEAPK